jgi:hypothetical protein
MALPPGSAVRMTVAAEEKQLIRPDRRGMLNATLTSLSTCGARPAGTATNMPPSETSPDTLVAPRHSLAEKKVTGQANFLRECLRLSYDS